MSTPKKRWVAKKPSFKVCPKDCDKPDFISFLEKVILDIEVNAFDIKDINIIIQTIDQIYAEKIGGETAKGFRVWRYLADGQLKALHKKVKETNFWLMAKRKVLNGLNGTSPQGKKESAVTFLSSWLRVLTMDESEISKTLLEIDPAKKLAEVNRPDK